MDFCQHVHRLKYLYIIKLLSVGNGILHGLNYMDFRHDFKDRVRSGL